MARLTPNQQTAVECMGKPLFIQAGAGTGKTFTLTKRLAYGLSDESGPLLPGVESVLTITFTNKAAAELLEPPQAASDSVMQAAMVKARNFFILYSPYLWCPGRKNSPVLRIL